MMDRFTLQLSSFKPVSASIPICSFFYLSDSHSRSFITVFKIKNDYFKMNNKKTIILKEKLAFRKKKIQNILKSWSFRYRVISINGKLL